MLVHNVEQGTPEWFACRKGKMTASHATAIANVGKGLDTYVLELMAETYSSKEKEHFSSKDTERGNEYEPVARAIYEFETGNVVEEVGFIEHNEYVGCSPGGLIEEDGGLEIKCVDDKKYFAFLLYGEKAIDSGHRWQVQMNLKITGRKWWDLFIYNPNFKQAYVVYRIYPDQDAFDKLEEGFTVGEEMIKSIKDKIKE